MIKKRCRPDPGDRIEVTFLPSEEIDLTPEPIPLELLYEDDHLICINKPSGMVVHPAPGHPKGTFVHALLHHCQEIPLPGKEYRPGIVHRLDKETSGILIAAKSVEAHQKLIEQFKGREIEKEYLAITVGNPQALTIHAPIGRHPIHHHHPHSPRRTFFAHLCQAYHGADPSNPGPYETQQYTYLG